MVETVVEEALISKAQKAKQAGRKFRLPKPKRQVIPILLEKEFLRQFNKIISDMEKQVTKNIIKELPNLVEENEAKKPTTDGLGEVRLDVNIGRRLRALFKKTRIALKKKNPPKKVARKMNKLSKQINRFNKNQVGEVFKSVLGVKLFQNEPFLKQELEEFSIANVNLIENVSQDFLDKTQQVVFRGLRRGLRHEEIAQQILGRVKDDEGFASTLRKAKSRAALIARDQVNKLNGQLTQLRQQNAGVKKYKWRTVRDTRVRKEHKRREGVEFSWDNPPPDGHPGEPIHCRCFPEPVLDDLI